MARGGGAVEGRARGFSRCGRGWAARKGSGTEPAGVSEISGSGGEVHGARAASSFMYWTQKASSFLGSTSREADRAHPGAGWLAGPAHSRQDVPTRAIARAAHERRAISELQKLCASTLSALQPQRGRHLERAALDWKCFTWEARASPVRFPGPPAIWRTSGM